MKTKVKIMQFKKDGTITEKLVNITNLYYVYFDGKSIPVKPQYLYFTKEGKKTIPVISLDSNNKPFNYTWSFEAARDIEEAKLIFLLEGMGCSLEEIEEFLEKRKER